MKILILHQHFKTPLSGGAIRSWYLAKGLVDAGHHPVVITSHNEKNYLHTTIDGIDVHYLPVRYDNSFDYYKRSVAFLRFVAQSIRVAARIQGVDCIYAISVPLTIAFVARWVSFRKNVPYYFEVGDLWPDAPIEMGFVRNPLMKSTLFSLERSAYNKAKAVVALSPSIKDSILKKAPSVDVAMIPNMADCEYYRPGKKDPQVESKLGVEGKFVVSYIGATGLANGLDYFLECAKSAAKADLPIHFIISGTGALLERLKKSAALLNLKNLTFTGFIDREGVRGILNVTDAVFVCYKDVPILETGSPNKFFDGLAAGKLIVINFGGWIKREIEDNKCGIAISKSDASNFVNKIRVFITDPDLLKEYQMNARKLAERKYDRRQLVDQWISFLLSR
ncbi:MAG TPA: glycosyltransferase family 4 protein [Cyclobacteriaceae bacterium]|nr:glycosyltransferase family 4 protein [Cyclobacteriaceae bacterium]